MTTTRGFPGSNAAVLVIAYAADTKVYRFEHPPKLGFFGNLLSPLLSLQEILNILRLIQTSLHLSMHFPPPASYQKPELVQPAACNRTTNPCYTGNKYENTECSPIVISAIRFWFKRWKGMPCFVWYFFPLWTMLSSSKKKQRTQFTNFSILIKFCKIYSLESRTSISAITCMSWVCQSWCKTSTLYQQQFLQKTSFNTLHVLIEYICQLWRAHSHRNCVKVQWCNVLKALYM